MEVDDARCASILSRGTLLLHLLLAKSIQLISCKVCQIPYVGSTTTKFRFRFNNHKYRLRAHTRLSDGDKSKDDLIYTYTKRVCMNSLHGKTDNENIFFHVFVLSL